jgi:hypothetical protein
LTRALAMVDDDMRTSDARWARGVQIGDHNTQYNYLTGRTQVSWPHLVGVLPALADRRVDRPVDRDLAATDAGIVLLCQVLAGLGGVGKTQLAAGLAHRLWKRGEVDLLVWTTATSRPAIVGRYAQAAADVTGVEDPDPVQAADRFLAWLAGSGRRWLIVLDDLADPADLTGLWPPTVPDGRAIVTTRRRDAALLAGRRLIDVGLFTPAEAGRYLRGKVDSRPGHLDEAGALAADLGYLPLALGQAAAFIADQGLTCAEYRRRLSRLQLDELAPDALPDDYRAALAATWSLSIDQADKLKPVGLARPVLQLVALLDPNGIPAELFATEAVRAYCAGRLDRPVNVDDLHDAARLLHRFSLATVDDTSGTVRVHGLVQRAVREAPDFSRYSAELAVTAADALHALWPDAVQPIGERERAASVEQTLRANVSALRNHSGLMLWSGGNAAHPILLVAGNSLGSAGLVADARAYFRDLQLIAERQLGADHPDALAARHFHARWTGQAGHAADARDLLANLVPHRIRTLGPDHPDTLFALADLARWTGWAGDTSSALDQLAELIPTFERVLGAEHPHTLTVRLEEAYWRGEAGDPAGARDMYADLAGFRERISGADHRDTLTSRYLVAYWTGEAGDPATARDLLAGLLPARTRVLGSDNLQILRTRRDHARWTGEAGDPAAALDLLSQLLPTYERLVGFEHPDYLIARRDFARWVGETGDAESARELLRELLPSVRRIRGDEHRDVLIVRGDLAHWQGRSGDPAAAADALEKLLSDCEQHLGASHRYTQSTSQNLGLWRRLVTVAPDADSRSSPSQTNGTL